MAGTVRFTVERGEQAPGIPGRMPQPTQAPRRRTASPEAWNDDRYFPPNLRGKKYWRQTAYIIAYSSAFRSAIPSHSGSAASTSRAAKPSWPAALLPPLLRRRLDLMAHCECALMREGIPWMFEKLSS